MIETGEVPLYTAFDGASPYREDLAPIASLKGLLIALPISGALWVALIAGTNAIL